MRNALLASLLHAAQRSLTGISSIVSDLDGGSELREQLRNMEWSTYAAISSGVAITSEMPVGSLDMYGVFRTR